MLVVPYDFCGDIFNPEARWWPSWRSMQQRWLDSQGVLGPEGETRRPFALLVFGTAARTGRLHFITFPPFGLAVQTTEDEVSSS